MMRRTFGLCTTLIALSGFAYACGSAGGGFGLSKDTPSGNGGAGSDAAAASMAPKLGDNSLPPVDNAVILVHAAKSQSFRLCFEHEPDRRPQPDSDLMPEANVVGVEVGSAVRLGPLKGAPGLVYLFEEPLIRAFYPAFGGAGAGPTCGQLLSNSSLGALAVTLGAPVLTDLSSGVHLLVVRGCSGNTPLRTYSLAECGDGWTAAKGNLSVKEITLPGAKRPSAGTLPAQVVNLSQPLDSSRAGRNVVVSFGDLSQPGAQHVTVSSNPVLYGEAQPNQPVELAYASNDIAIYDSVGFRVAFAANGDGGADAGGQKVLDESLARIQKLSSPRDVPPSYYAAASNYALLLLGDPNAKLADGGPDNDDRRNVHFLAVPVIGPKGDGGADGAGDGGDAAAAPLP